MGGGLNCVLDLLVTYLDIWWVVIRVRVCVELLK